MKKLYNTPELLFVTLESEKDILLTSSEIEFTRDEKSDNYGITFPF